MARPKVIFLSCLVIMSLLMVQVSAATLQGLEWGIEEGSQFNFDFTTTGDDPVSEIMYFECTNTPVIPNIVDTWAELSSNAAEFDITWANGTSLSWGALIFIFYVVAIDHFAVPTGNYTLLGELYEASMYNGTIIDEGGYWGVVLDNFDFFGTLYDVHVDFLKQDGMLAHWTVSYENETLGLTRQNLPSGLDNILDFLSNNMLLVVGGIGVLIILAIVCTRRK